MPRIENPLSPRFEYPIVRHNPLFAKQKSAGDRSNLSSLLLGQNVRIIRRSVGGIGEAVVHAGGSTQPHAQQAAQPTSSTAGMKSFEIFNPETDDLDSDDEASDVEEEDEGEEIGIRNKGDSEEEDDSESNDDSVESVVSVVSLATDKAEQLPQQQQGGCCSVMLCIQLTT